jgi:hypothetical protein
MGKGTYLAQLPDYDEKKTRDYAKKIGIGNFRWNAY